jgi:hypothetical protein
MTLRRRRTGPLNRYGENHLAHRRPVGGCTQRTSLINELNQIQLLGDPYQCPPITDPLGAYSAQRPQVGDGRRISGPQHSLACEGSLANGIPHGLGCDSVAPATHHPLKNVHFFHLATFEQLCQAKSTPIGPGGHSNPALNTQICESRASDRYPVTIRSALAFRAHSVRRA